MPEDLKCEECGAMGKPAANWDEAFTRGRKIVCYLCMCQYVRKDLVLPTRNRDPRDPQFKGFDQREILHFPAYALKEEVVS